MSRENPNYYKGELKQERIDQLNRLLYRIVANKKGWLKLSDLVAGTDHGYKNDNTAYQSIIRYFRMGKFHAFEYKRGMVRRKPESED